MSIRNLLRGRGAGARLGATALMSVLAAGCLSDITKVTERDEIPPEAIVTAAGATALYAGAIRAFGRAIDGDNGGTEGQILVSGMVADEWFHSGTFNTRRDYDQRAIVLDNGTLAGIFRRLQDARTSGLRAVDALVATSENAAGDERMGELQNRVGGVFLTVAQNYCSGVPFTNVVDGELVYGVPQTTAEIITTAIGWFDQALAGPAGEGSVNEYTARLLKARALMLQGNTQFAAAAALVASVPTDFHATSEHALNNGNENGVFVFNHLSERWSMAHRDGINGLPFRGAGDGTDPAQADPRILWDRTDGDNVGFDDVSPQYNWLGSGDREAPHDFTNGIEARLIEAEAALDAGDAGTMLAKLNALRTTVPGLAPLADPGTTALRVDMLFSERGFWLYGIGTRLSDLRRLVRQYGRNAESVFPTGPYPKGGDYGTDVNLPVPSTEDQNPEFKKVGAVCADRNA